jgi:hypothetical protein
MVNPLNIVIVGPGMMPIPPPGWGAVEILIWDYAKLLELNNHNVTILNDKNLSNVINKIKDIKPDIVHIQYDDYAHIVSNIKDSAKIIAITSHFGYIEQPNKWGPYSNVFQSIINQNYPNVYHFVLSEAIANVYKSKGVSNNKIIVTPNGANDIVFKYTTNPEHLDRSLYLAKIDYRKRQFMFQTIHSLYFAGNNVDNRFDTNSSRYLGEWSKQQLYNNLSHYGNLVLLSDGEADPLVVKEALICGLGVVISQWSTAGLDLTKPYITVIPEDRITDLAFVESEIKRNRELSAGYRNEIREYGLSFTWSRLVDKYVKKIQELIIE